ncbi:MAG: DHHW family protein [Angelakisella sp.]|nr:DHHW family protein [Angelakisella sp.]
MEKMKQLKQYPLLIAFGAFILVLFVADMLCFGREYSEMENRFLKQRPKFSVKSLISNEYTMKYEEFINDQFVGRDQWITIKSVSESVLGKIENNNVAYGKDDYMFEKAPTVDEKTLWNNVGFVQKFLESYPGHVTFGIIPNSYQVLNHKTPVSFPGADQGAYIGEIYSRIGTSAQTVDLLNAISAHKNEYIYYKTDHHWTTLGAWYGYQAYAQSLGLQYATLEELASYLHQVPDFLGTYFSKGKKFDAQKDTITWYDIPVGEVTIDGKTTVMDTDKNQIPVTGLYDHSKWAVRDKYAAFLYSNNGLTFIPSNNNKNHVDGKVSRVLLIKDSYGNSMAPFLTYSYDEVYVVDLRSLPEKMSELLARVQFDDVLILYNFQSFEMDKNIARLTY